MLQFVCDNCSAVKQPEDVWIVGLAAEAVGAVSARREVTIESTWNRANTLHPLAVHFCSIQCKDEYLSRLFAPETPVREVTVERTAPAEVVERTVPERQVVITKTRKVQRRKRAA